MGAAHIEVDELQRLARDAGGTLPGGGRGPGVLVVDLDDADGLLFDDPVPAGLAAVVVGTSRRADVRPALCDVVVEPDGPTVDLITDAVDRNPVASMTLVELLRCSPGLTPAGGLLAESASYGVLQAGGEFRRWKDGRSAGRPRVVQRDPDPVLVERADDELHLRLHRPAKRNALDVSMRDALAEQLNLASLDPTIRRIVLDGAGPDFCSGGDLDEFGSADDVSVAHLIRLERSLGRMLHAVADRLTVRVHGACIGSGIELSSFAHAVHATAEVSIALPEIAMGLVPGAGGTVSVTQRIGRHRACRLALTGERIDAATALDWGLVDSIGVRSAATS